MATLNEMVKAAQRSAPVNVEGLADDLGVKVRREFLEDDISGELVRVGEDEFQINVNVMDSLTRQRFTIAHELGHFIFHRSLIGDGVDDNRAYRSTDQGRYHNQAIGRAEETQANKFAASFLMPMQLIEPLQRQGLTVAQMAKRLQVSQHALSIRLGIPYEA